MAPSLVQSHSSTGTTGTSVTVTLTSPTTAGNCLVVCAGTEGTTTRTVTGVTLGGSAGNFALAKGQTQAGTENTRCEIWTDQNCAGGQTSVVVTFSGAPSASAVWVEEWSGILTSSAVDKTSSAGGTTTSWSSGASGTLTQASEVAVGAVFCATGAALTITGPASPWTNLAQAGGAGGGGLLAGYQVVSATTSLTYSGTQNGSTFESSAAVIVTLKGLSDVSVSLTVAQVNVAAPAPAAGGSVPLSVAQVNVAAPAVAPVASVSVSLAVAQVAISALPPAPRMSGVSLPVAQVTVAVPPVLPAVGVSVPLTVAQVTIAAPAPALGGSKVALAAAAVSIAAPAPALAIGKSVPLTVAAVTVSARPPAPAVSVHLALATAQVTVTAHGPALSRQLLISLASKAGTDDYGNAFPLGIYVTAGIIEGPVLISSDAFYYSPSPGAGNLASSVTSAPGTDQYGNAYLAGTSSYQDAGGGVWLADQQFGDGIVWYTASSYAGPWTFTGEIQVTSGGFLTIQGSGDGGWSGTIPQSSAGITTVGQVVAALQNAGILIP